MKKIRKEVLYPHPPERVWRALTDPVILGRWLMESDIQPRVGHKFQFRMKPRLGFDGIIYCEVLEAEPPRRLSYTWTGSANKQPTLVEWTLTATKGGTQLVLEHSGFEGIGGFFMRAMMSSGWGKKLTEPQFFRQQLEKIAGGT